MTKTAIKIVVGAYVMYLLGSLGLGAWYVHMWTPKNIMEAAGGSDSDNN